jgi:hypothetical protein
MTGEPHASWFWFGLSALAVWRVTHLLHVEDGPWDLIAKGRRALASLGLGDLVRCFYCLSVWIAAPAALWLVSGWPERLIAWLALSAAAILLEVAVIGPPTTPPDDER